LAYDSIEAAKQKQQRRPQIGTVFILISQMLCHFWTTFYHYSSNFFVLHLPLLFYFVIFLWFVYS